MNTFTQAEREAAKLTQAERDEINALSDAQKINAMKDIALGLWTDFFDKVEFLKEQNADDDEIHKAENLRDRAKSIVNIANGEVPPTLRKTAIK